MATKYVHVAPAGNRTGTNQYHLKSDCRQLGRSVRFPANLTDGDDWELCNVCAGSVDRSKSGSSQDHYQAAINHNG